MKGRQDNDLGEKRNETTPRWKGNRTMSSRWKGNETTSRWKKGQDNDI